METPELLPSGAHLGDRVIHDGPHCVSFGVLTRIAPSGHTADFLDEETGQVVHTHAARIYPLPCQRFVRQAAAPWRRCFLMQPPLRAPASSAAREAGVK